MRHRQPDVTALRCHGVVAASLPGISGAVGQNDGLQAGAPDSRAMPLGKW